MIKYIKCTCTYSYSTTQIKQGTIAEIIFSDEKYMIVKVNYNKNNSFVYTLRKNIYYKYWTVDLIPELISRGISSIHMGKVKGMENKYLFGIYSYIKLIEIKQSIKADANRIESIIDKYYMDQALS